MRRPEMRHRRANARSPQGGDPAGVAPDRPIVRCGWGIGLNATGHTSGIVQPLGIWTSPNDGGDYITVGAIHESPEQRLWARTGGGAIVRCDLAHCFRCCAERWRPLCSPLRGDACIAPTDFEGMPHSTPSTRLFTVVWNKSYSAVRLRGPERSSRIQRCLAPTCRAAMGAWGDIRAQREVCGASPT